MYPAKAGISRGKEARGGRISGYDDEKDGSNAVGPAGGSCMNGKKQPGARLNDAQFAEFSRKMEQRMNQLTDLRTQLEKTGDLLEKYADSAWILQNWYFEGDWLADRDREAAHPLHQPCGIYSEDGLYNLFGDLEDLCRAVEADCRKFRRRIRPDKADGQPV